MQVEPSSEVDDLARSVIGAAIEVHRLLGAGFLESVYEKALAVEMRLRGITFERQWPFQLRYKNESVGDVRVDFLVGQKLIVELKAVDDLAPLHHAQVLNYLRATRMELGLLINFNVALLKQGIRRVVLTDLH